MSNRKKLYADMEKFRKTRNAQRTRYYKRSQKYSSRPWSLEEDKQVLAHDITDSKLSELIKRSVGAIQTRRSFLKSIGEEVES